MGVNGPVWEADATLPSSSQESKQNRSRTGSPAAMAKSQSRRVSQESQGVEFSRDVSSVSVMSYLSTEVVEARWEALSSMIEVERDARAAENRELRAILAELTALSRRCENEELFDKFRFEIEEKLVAIGTTCEEHIDERLSQCNVTKLVKGFEEEMEKKLATIESRLAQSSSLLEETLHVMTMAESVFLLKKDDGVSHSDRKNHDGQTEDLAESLVLSQQDGSASLSAGRSSERDYASNAMLARSASTPHVTEYLDDTSNVILTTELSSSLASSPLTVHQPIAIRPKQHVQAMLRPYPRQGQAKQSKFATTWWNLANLRASPPRFDQMRRDKHFSDRTLTKC